MKKGLVSITFRKFGTEKIVKICKNADLEYIEWGGDIHVPAGDLPAAEYTAKLCRDNGLIPVGYGPIIMKVVIQVIVCGYCTYRAREYFGTKPGSFMYILFLLYPVIAYTTSARSEERRGG